MDENLIYCLLSLLSLQLSCELTRVCAVCGWSRILNIAMNCWKFSRWANQSGILNKENRFVRCPLPETLQSLMWKLPQSFRFCSLRVNDFLLFHWTRRLHHHHQLTGSKQNEIKQSENGLKPSTASMGEIKNFSHFHRVDCGACWNATSCNSSFQLLSCERDWWMND